VPQPTTLPRAPSLKQLFLFYFPVYSALLNPKILLHAQQEFDQLSSRARTQSKRTQKPYALSGIEAHDPSVQAGEVGSHLRAYVHCDLLKKYCLQNPKK
jgi:hypothetical protein